MKCPNCGHLNEADAHFCENCGFDLTKVNEAKLPEANDSWFCPNCGHQNSNSNIFCEECGFKKPIEEKAAPIQPVTEPQKVPLTAKQPGLQNEPTELQQDATKLSKSVPPKKNKKGLIIGSIVAVIVLLGLGGTWLYLANKGDSHSEKADPVVETSSKKASKKAKPTKESLPFNKNVISRDATAVTDSINAETGFYISPVDAKTSVKHLGSKQMRSASSIKLFILATAFQKAKDGSFDLNGEHTLADDEKVAGTGTVQSMPDGSKIKNRELLEHMIVDSDNTAANIIIDELGGIDEINDQIDEFGATSTRLERKMLDQAALDAGKDNYTSAQDMGRTLKLIYNHKLVSKKYDQEMLDILAQTHNHEKLLKNLPAAAKTYNKTGEYAQYGTENDAAIIEVPGKGAIIVAVMSQDPEKNSDVQREMMSRLGLKIYQDYFE